MKNILIFVGTVSDPLLTEFAKEAHHYPQCNEVGGLHMVPFKGDDGDSGGVVSAAVFMMGFLRRRRRDAAQQQNQDLHRDKSEPQELFSGPPICRSSPASSFLKRRGLRGVPDPDRSFL